MKKNKKKARLANILPIKHPYLMNKSQTEKVKLTVVNPLMVDNCNYDSIDVRMTSSYAFIVFSKQKHYIFYMGQFRPILFYFLSFQNYSFCRKIRDFELGLS